MSQDLDPRSLVPGWDGPQRLGHGVRRPRNVYGATVQVLPGQTMTAIDTPVTEEERTWTVVVQVQNAIPANGVGGITPLTGKIRFWGGEAPFTRSFVRKTAVIYRAVVSSRRLTVDLTWLGTPAAGTPVTVSVAAFLGAIPSSAFYGAQWVTDITGAGQIASFGQLATGAGLVTAFNATIKAMPGGVGTVWLLLFDQANNAKPAANTAPIAGGCSPGMTMAGSGGQLEDESGNEPGVEFQNGLVYALSSTPDVYTDPGGGTVRVDAKVAQ